MSYDDDAKDQHDYPHHTTQSSGDKAGGYKVDDDDNIEEKDLKRTYIFGDSEVADAGQPGMEGEGYGGQNFNKSSETTSGDDPANPSRNAGYHNDYFKRTEPAEEHPENSNFKPQDQQTQPSDDNSYQEGTADYDGGTINGGRGHERPTQIDASSEQADASNNVQHKIGEQNQTEPGKARDERDYDDSTDEDDDRGHIET